jgi:hypothetical protein
MRVCDSPVKLFGIAVVVGLLVLSMYLFASAVEEGARRKLERENLELRLLELEVRAMEGRLGHGENNEF